MATTETTRSLLMNLPKELVLEIAEFLDLPELNSFLYLSLYTGYSPSLRTKGKIGVLLEATRNRHENVIKLLLDIGLQPDHTDTGETALHFTAYSGQENVARVLLDHGANVSAVNGAKTLLALVLTYNRLTMVKLCIEKGADPDASAGGKTVLWAIP
ncbi:ankyrin repeat-containing domain protein [Talaromyces proteolyticus]|uniref:Ankyrin repeat-containing domain protein n=1 Tax=Talaromyces proteolyticus TaxID=1131652 RepID=A0AAD4KZQ1_9EURO|nr:ankyrin repeat-containing domain protein [Talaromyces proteolyticus]KAH8701081.1 ankyrin repeat-containing domain protein [Talaromyces proteolyticus]